MTASKNVYVSVAEKLVRKINYTDKKTGEPRSFYSVRVPYGAVVDGVDLAGGEFTSRFANHPAKFLGKDYTDIPLLADRQVWVDVPIRDGAGNVITGKDGRWVTNTYRLDPADLAAAFDKSRADYLRKVEGKVRAQPDANSPETPDSGWDDATDSVLADKDIDF